VGATDAGDVRDLALRAAQRHVGPGNANPYDIAIGSRTAFNAEDLAAMGTGSSLRNTTKTILSPSTWPGKANDLWTKWQAGKNLDAIAHIITDPGSQRLFSRLAEMPSSSNEARRVAMRISAIGWVASQQRDKEKQPAQ
jgi:hypothetical protein